MTESPAAAVIVATDALPDRATLRLLFRRAPRDFTAALAVLFIESYCMFNFFNILMWLLASPQLAFSDRESGWIFAAFGLAAAVYTMALGPVVDRMLVRKSLLAVLLLAAAVSLVVGVLYFSRIAVLICLFGPLPIAVGLGSPVVQIAIRRYTTPDTQTLAFATQYVIMNAASACAQLSVDVFRLVFGNAYWHVFVVGQTGFHGLALLLTWLWIRDVQVPVSDDPDTQPIPDARGKWPISTVLPPPSASPAGGGGGMLASVRDAARDGMFWRLALLCVCVIGAKAVFVFLYTIYPLYLQRAPYVMPAAGLTQDSIPFMSFLVIDPIICVALAWVVATLVTRHQWSRFWAIFVGTTIVAGSPFLMMPYSYFAVIAFIAVQAVGEAIWAPLFLRYSCEFTPHGREGVYFGLVGIVLFLGKLLGGLSGELMQHYCPAREHCAQGYMVWLIVGAVCLSTPLLLLASSRWTWLRAAAPVAYVEMTTT